MVVNMQKRKKTKQNKERDGESKMAILTAECDRMFSVDKDQIGLFKSVTKNQRQRDKANITVSKIAKKITIENQLDDNDKT